MGVNRGAKRFNRVDRWLVHHHSRDWSIAQKNDWWGASVKVNSVTTQLDLIDWQRFELQIVSCIVVIHSNYY